MDGKDYDFDGETYVHTDKDTGVKYRWDLEKKEWILIEGAGDATIASNSSGHGGSDPANAPQGTYTYEGDTAIYTDPSDGTPYEWDAEKKAWIPKVDDEFIARYQLSYGFTEESRRTPSEIFKAEQEAAAKKEEERLAKKRPAGVKEEPTWFELDEKHNTKVYVSGLPSDITEQEFLDMMQKCGLVMKDLDTGRMKVKLYSDSEGNLKGDALCSYIKIESVDLAVQFLDGSQLRGHTIHVEPAKFQMKGNFNPNLKPKKKRKRDKEKMKKIQEKLFDWRPDKLRGERDRNERCVVIKNLFEPNLFDKEVALILEYQQDLREECSKCGDVRKVIIYDRNPEGVAQIFFREAEEADACIKLLNNRWFGQRQITAETWDGKTKYKIGETDAEIQQRLQNWESFLDSDDMNKKKDATPVSTSAPSVSSASNSDTAVEEPKEAVKPSEPPVSDDKKSSDKPLVESDAESGDETEGEEEEPNDE